MLVNNKGFINVTPFSQLPSGKTSVKEENIDGVSIGSGNSLIDLHILHINDFHGAVQPYMEPSISADSEVGGVANLKSVIDTERERDLNGTLLLNAGDLAEGTMTSYVSKGRVVGDAFKFFKFDAITPGNHDFAWGKDGFNSIVQGLDTPVLAGNIVNTADGKVMEGISPYTILEKKGVKIGIIGIDTPETAVRLNPEKFKGIEFKSPAETAQKYIAELKEKGVEIIVVTSHLGLPEDEKLASEVEGIDVIVGGHTHNKLEEGKKVGNTVIVQAGTKGGYLGKLDLQIDSITKKIVSHTAKLIPVIASQVKPDKDVQAAIAPYISEAEKFGSEVMGMAKEDIHYSHSSASKIPQILADAIVKQGGTKIGLCSARAVRGNIPAGAVYKEDLFNAVPFTDENTLTVDIKGKYIKQYLEDGFKDGAKGVGIPGGALKCTCDPTRPSGDRVTSLTVEGKEINPEETYTIAINDSIISKKSFATAENKKVIGPFQPAFFEYFQTGEVWDDKIDDRIAIQIPQLSL
ncbi:MAG: bifunctional UDP-sugar hydrolase/5'-nucleotidase [Candidatus Eremiobacterota bacterium]